MQGKEAMPVETELPVLSLLEPRPGERVLDMGSGNGDLTAAIAAAGAIPTGVDLSEEMVRRARQKYPDLDFQVADTCRYRTDVRFDAVFSHATLHWIQDAPAAARSIWLALRDGGRFVAEFAGQYATLLEQTGFRVTLAQHFDKPTPLKGGAGIRFWLEGFAQYFFHDVTAADKESIYRSIEAQVAPHLYTGGQWMIDTSRLRVVAVKKPG